MSTLRVSNIEAKADPSSPSVNEKVKITNSNGDVMLQLDGATSGITTVGINTTTAAFTVDSAQNIQFVGIVTAANGFSGNLTGTASTATAAATAYGLSGSPTLTGITSVSTTNLTVNGNAYPATGPLSNRNKIINGDCRIDQRNAGSSGTATGSFTVDRWFYFASQESKGTWQQNAGSVTPPVGFDYYLGYTSSSSYTLLSGDLFGIAQAIEGYNISDLAYGTANAKPITISFWVRSSLTGLFGGFLKNGGTSSGNNTRFCPFSYTINSANTWEYKTITINGDTTGSWESTNGPAFSIGFSLGNGSTYTGGTSGTWSGTQYLQPSGCVNLVETNGATLYLTGVQIEVGTVATPFEHRSYGDDLARCQRYYVNTNWVFCTSISGLNYRKITPGSGVTMRTNPVHRYTHPTTGVVNNVYEHSSGTTHTINETSNASSRGPQPSTFFGLSSTPSYDVLVRIEYSAEI